MAASDLIVGHVGACGSGKTWRLKERVATAVRMGWCAGRGRIVVADVKREWPRGPRDPLSGPLTVGSAVPMGRLTGRLPAPDAELPAVTILRPAGGWPEERIAQWFEAVCAWAIERGDVIVVAPEAWRYAPQELGTKLPPQLARVSHEHRHELVGLWFDFQSFPEVNKRLVRRCGWLFLHGTGAHEDLERLRRMGGRPLERAVVAAMQRNHAAGPGHFVRFQPTHPLPPYELRDPRGRVIGVFGASGDAGRFGGES